MAPVTKWQSIVTDDYSHCYICGRRGWLEKHHICGGASRSQSEHDGLYVMLCHYCHNEPPNGVHHNIIRQRTLQAIGQKAWQEVYNKTAAEFVAVYGRNYIEEAEAYGITD